MLELSNLIFFILGGTIGFILACILAAGAREELIREHNSMLSEAKANRHNYDGDERKLARLLLDSDLPTGKI